MINEIKEKLNALKNEDLIWILSFFLVLASLISNQYERNAILENNPKFNLVSNDIKILIFTIALFIYIYFIFVTNQSIEKLKNEISCNNKQLIIEQARLVASLLFFIGGIIFLITEIEKNKSI